MRSAILLILGVAILFASSCASVYHNIEPQETSLLTYNSNDSLEFWYRYNVLSLNGNKKYAKKASSKGMQVIAAKLKNNSNQPLNVARDIRVSTQWGDLMPLDPSFVVTQMRQKVWIYLLYSFLNIRFFECDTDDCRTTMFIPSGFVLAGINIGISLSANRKLQKNLSENNFLTKTIAPGEEIYGIFVFRDSNSQPLEIHRK